MDQKHFSSLDEVLPYLQAEGFKISRRTLFRHAKEGKIKPNGEAGIYDLKKVSKYARLWLKVAGTLNKLDEDAQAKRRVELDQLLKEEEIKIKKIQRERLEGLYVLKADLGMELAARAAIFDALLKGEMESSLSEIISLVAGDESKAAGLLRFLHEIIDRGLTEYASTRTWQVLFQKLDDGADPELEVPAGDADGNGPGMEKDLITNEGIEVEN